MNQQVSKKIRELGPLDHQSKIDNQLEDEEI
jgi:hypothetical protein